MSADWPRAAAQSDATMIITMMNVIIITAIITVTPQVSREEKEPQGVVRTLFFRVIPVDREFKKKIQKKKQQARERKIKENALVLVVRRLIVRRRPFSRTRAHRAPFIRLVFLTKSCSITRRF